MPPSTGDNIGAGIATVSRIAKPLLDQIPPPYGPAVELALQVVSVVEPAAWNAISALFDGTTLTPEQQATLDDVKMRLNDPDSYLA